MICAPQQRAGWARLLLVSPAYSPSVGGVETCVRELAPRLIARGLDVSVLTADPSHALPRDETVEGILVHRIPAWPKGGDQRLAPGIAPQVAASGADLIHIHCYQTFVAPVAMAVAARRRMPYVVTFHGGGHSSALRHSIRSTQLAILRPLLARAAALVATAEWEIGHYSSMLDLPRSKFVRIPNGGDLPHVDVTATQSDHPLFVSIGRAERYKGHQHVLAAFPHVLHELPDAQLWIAGEGPYESELRRLADRLGVSERVEIGAIRDRQEYARRLAGATVATLLSEFETNPLGALEAILLGVPMLVANNSGLADLANQGHARAVELDGDSRSHAAELVSLARHPPPRNLAAPAILSWDQGADAHERLYAQVLAATPGSRR